MTNDDKDLKPCPFCGDTKYLRVTYQDSKANASITGDKKYWGVFCMEKCGASIDSIYPTREEAIRVWNTRATPQQPSEPMKELDFKPNGYDMDGNPIQYGFSGGSQQPSENKALSLDSIKTILTKIMKKELVDIGEHFCFVCGEPMSEEKRGLLIDYLAQAIEFALPARKEVKWPEKMDEERFYCEDGDIYRGREWNECRDACIKAYESAMPAQREVRYPEKLDHDHSCEFDCKGCISNGWNQAINKMRKLNGDKT